MNDQRKKRILVIGYGNPYRQDDRIGHVVADEIEQWACAHGIGIDVLTAYQLDLDMVEQIASAASVFFIDAHRPEYNEGMVCERIEPKDEAGFTTHAFTPSGLVAIAGRLAGTRPEAFIVSIPGYSFDLGEELSGRTCALATDAIALVQRMITERSAA